MWRAGLVAIILMVTTEAKALTVEGWRVLLFPINNQPSGCVMTAPLQDGTTFSLVVMSDFTWGISLANARWTLVKDGVTDVAAYVDRRFVASGKAQHLSGNLVLLPLTGADPYRALQRGHRLDLQTPFGNLSFGLKGTARAMAAVLGCVQALNRSTGQTGRRDQPGVRLVSAAEATAMLTGLLNTSGVRDYRLHTSPQNRNAVTFELSDGTVGLLAAARGRETKNVDDYASVVISRSSKLCKGSFISGKEMLPSASGNVVRKVTAMCSDGGEAIVTETTVIRRPDGLLIELSHMFRDEGDRLQTEARKGQMGAVMDAAVRTSAGWR